MPIFSTKTKSGEVFRFPNSLILLLAITTIVAGLVLMAGSGSTEESFRTEIFSVRRTVVAPILCLLGYLTIIIGIMWPHGGQTSRNKSEATSD